MFNFLVYFIVFENNYFTNLNIFPLETIFLKNKHNLRSI